MVYLSYALYPLVIGYAIYALKYETHKSWYSWILNSLVGAVYTFGFILMCPQVSSAAASFDSKTRVFCIAADMRAHPRFGAALPVAGSTLP